MNLWTVNLLKIKILESKCGVFRVYIFGVILILGSLLIGSVTTSLWMDDYPFFWGMVRDDPATINFILGSGRPFLALFISLGGNFSLSLQLLSYLKIIGLLGIIFTYTTITNRWHRLNFPKYSFLIAAIGLCLPTFQSYAFWASAFTYSWAPGLATLSLSMWGQGARTTKVFASLLFAISFLIYPPGALFIFGLIAAEFWISELSIASMVRTIKNTCVLVLVGTTISLLIIYGYVAAWNLDSNQRVELVKPDELLDKFSWFVTRVLVSSFRPFQISSPSPLEAFLSVVPTLLVFAFGLYKRFVFARQQYAISIILLLFPLVMSSFHSLALSENQFEFRFFPGQMWATFVILTVIVVKFMLLKWDFFLAKAFTFLSTFFVFSFVIVKSNLVYFELIKNPFDIKTTFLINTISNCKLLSSDRSLLFVVIPTKPKHLSNLGSYSIQLDSYYDWVIQPEVKLLDSFMAKPVSPQNDKGTFPSSYICKIRVAAIEQGINDAKSGN